MPRFKTREDRFPQEIEFLSIADVVSRSQPRERSACGLYFLSQGSEIVYVGKSNNVHLRLYQHHTQRRMVFNRYYLFPCPARLLDKLERHYIALFQPKYNKAPLGSGEYLASGADLRLTEAEIEGEKVDNPLIPQLYPALKGV